MQEVAEAHSRAQRGWPWHATATGLPCPLALRLQVTTPEQMTWIVQIILKNLKASSSAARGQKQANQDKPGGKEAGRLDLHAPKAVWYSPQGMLGSLQINCSETTILKAWHKDAFEYFNNSGMVRAEGGHWVGESLQGLGLGAVRERACNFRHGSTVEPGWGTGQP